MGKHFDERGNTIDFYLSHRRNAKAAKRFLKKLIKSNPTCDVSVINTDKNPAYGQAIKELKQEGSLASDVSHLQKNTAIIGSKLTTASSSASSIQSGDFNP